MRPLEADVRPQRAASHPAPVGLTPLPARGAELEEAREAVKVQLRALEASLRGLRSDAWPGLQQFTLVAAYLE